MNAKNIFGGILATFSIVVPLNFLLSRNAPCDYRIVGEDKDWLPFYGSLISALVAFFALQKTIKNDRHIADLDRKHQDLVELRNDLAERIASINISQILRVILSRNDFNITSELYRLDAISQDYMKLSNLTYLKYGIIDDENASEFCMAYCTLIDDVENDIDELIILPTNLRDRKIFKDSYENEMSKIAERITKERQKYYKEIVFPAAKKYLQIEKDKYNSQKHLSIANKKKQ